MMASAVEAGFAAATHDQVVRRGNDRDLRVFDRHHRLLEPLDRHGDLVERPFGDRHHQQHQVGAGGEHVPFVGDDQTDPLFFRPLDRLMDHGEDFAADGVHLGVELKAEDAVTQIDHGGAAVLFHLPAVFLEDRKADVPRFLRHFPVPAIVNAVVVICAVLEFVEPLNRLEPGRNLHTVLFGPLHEIGHADGVQHLERAELPVEAPLHGIVDVDDVVGDLRNPVEGVDQGVAQVGPGELGRLVAPGDDRLKAFGRIVNRLGRFNRGELGALRRLRTRRSCNRNRRTPAPSLP